LAGTFALSKIDARLMKKTYQHKHQNAFKKLINNNLLFDNFLITSV